ncbi:unnamed protein product [Meloidogyne enterolobii]|uniref:Uncharacterized protein n=1 Tax=Meloidogyne enterolobii TaxID=390850 RepID=A0ACB1B574_MELEN
MRKHLLRLPIKLSTTTIAFRYKSKTKFLAMQNPFEVPTYQVGNQTYRRNCPLEMVNTTNPAAVSAQKFNEMEEEEERSCEMIEEATTNTLLEIREEQEKPSHSKEVFPPKEESSSTSTDEPEHLNKEILGPTPPKKIQIEILEEQQTIIKNNKETLIIEKEEKQQIKLIDSIKYDTKDSLYYDKIQIPGALIGLIKGKEGYKQRVMEKEFGCKIHYPKKKEKVHGKMTEIKITSPQSAENVLKCRDALEIAVEKARKQAMPTHFVSVPVGLTSVKIREQYQNFVHNIRADEDLPEDCKNPDLFITPSKLHLTLCVLRLFTEEDVNSAKQFLDELFRSEAVKEIFTNSDLEHIQLEFTELEHFEDRPTDKIAVLFAKCVSERLQKLANIVEESLSASFLTEKRKSKEVVLHMTMMNTKYLREKKRSFLNVSKLLEKFGKLNFDPVNISELHLCEMSSLTDAELALETYKCIHQLQFPTK